MNRIILSPFPELKTERFRLRQLTPNDTNEIFYLRSDSIVNKYLDRTPAKDLDDALQFILKICNLIKDNKVIYWGIVPLEKDKLIGTICFWNFSDDYYSAEIGFELMPEYQGKRIMQEVLTKVIDYGFNQLQLKSILGEVDPNNLRSLKILKRNNFVLKTDTHLPKTVIYELKKQIV